MIDLGTLTGFHEHDHALAAYCLGYGRWAALLLADRVAHGKGPVRLAIKLRGKAKRPQRGRSLRFDGSGGALLRLETDWIEIALR